ncbi:phage tail assembly protein [Aquamicrobium zhengzhouense]|uniref:Phage tail assembly protein n=1 Tax=Aquamicrobium zhengzhouense TaxID=2781738 RepID=A0ABS0SDL4_9HYPH|nr:phage tail assembly protein [Aquamicrobium zhengzhouense]MBI1620801.1 phage tail assembly protein [Aquamicrobium zhengzhouense]
MTTIKLSKPVEHAGTTYSEISVREPEMGDFMAADLVTGDQTKEAAIYASIAGIPLPAMKKLRPLDYKAIVVAADKLAGNALAPESGDTSPA